MVFVNDDWSTAETAVPFRLAENGNRRFLASHEVLICKTCRYAVQPGALARHLKERISHQAYRGRRRPYAAYVDGLILRRPEDVVPLRADQLFPVPHLPVEQGLQCVSTKRMECHWPQKHGRKGRQSHDWRPALLQTFFRGNMLRYFTNDSEAATMGGVRVAMSRAREAFSLDDLDNPPSAALFLLDMPRLACDRPFLLHSMLAMHGSAQGSGRAVEAQDVHAPGLDAPGDGHASVPPRCRPSDP